MTRKQVLISILIAFLVGSVGSLLLAKFILPPLSNVRGLGWLSKLTTNAPIVINRTEEIHLNEGVNYIGLAKQTGKITVGIYDAKNNFLANGVIMTSDGLIFTSTAALGNQTQLSVVTDDGMKYTVASISKGAKNIAAVRIQANGLAIAQLDNAADLVTGSRVMYVGRSNVKFEHLAMPGFITQSLANQLSVEKQISSDAVVSSDFFGGPIVNLNGRVVGLTISGTQNVVSEDLRIDLSNFLSKANE